jgi:serine/threonine protein kinase
MAKRFGERWEIVDQLPSKGGQADLFLVRDLRGQYADPCVLKRIRNPKRIERFRAEVEAGTRLKHENIMPILDHSGLEASSENQPMYIVMPYATAGSLEDRAKLYADSLDSTIKVGVAVAKALAHAHAANPRVIHRDVKPPNILFRAQDHDALLADFGICLIADRARATETGEVVGPWAFMAPELEGGGQLDVGPSADLYLVGKVIYFMISGGVVLPRESHREKAYDLHSKAGGYELLWLLLDQLICPVERRITSAVEVVARLEEIEAWDRRPAIHVSDAARASVSKMTEADLNRESVQKENQAIRKRRDAEFMGVAKSLGEWLNEQVRMQAEHLHRPGAFETGGEFESPPKKLSNGWSAAFGREHYAPIWSVNLLVRRPKAFPGGDHWLTFILAQKREMRISFGGHVPPEPDKPVEGLLVPMYFRSPDWCGFLSRAKAVQQVPARDRLGRSMVTHQQAERVRRGFYGESMTICLKLDLAAWPGDIARYEDLIKESLEVFLAYIEAGASVLGQ